MSAVVIKLGSQTWNLENGETHTFNCKNGFLSLTDNLSVTFNSAGYYTYLGLTRAGKDGATSKLRCAGKMALDNVVVVAGEYGGGSSSPLPIEIATEEEMTEILTSANAGSVGAVYKYIGETTDTYTHGTLYIIDEDN